jgi:hypothetical protein
VRPGGSGGGGVIVTMQLGIESGNAWSITLGLHGHELWAKLRREQHASSFSREMDVAMLSVDAQRVVRSPSSQSWEAVGGIPMDLFEGEWSREG